MAVEPCPSSSPCHQLSVSHQPALLPSSCKSRGFLSPSQLLPLPPAVSSLWVIPAASCTSGRCFFSQGFTGVLHPPFPLFPLVFWEIPRSAVRAKPPSADSRTRQLGKTRIAIPRGHFWCFALPYPVSAAAPEQLQVSRASLCLCSPGCWGRVELQSSDGSAALEKPGCDSLGWDTGRLLGKSGCKASIPHFPSV